MARTRKAKDNHTPDPSPDRQLSTPSGWCITGHHTQCKFGFSHGKCGCSCHVAPKRRGRPPKSKTE